MLTEQTATDLFRAPPHRFVDVEGGQIAVRTVGDGPDVLFVHGWPVTGATWRKLLPHLAPHVTCHVLDLVGTGASRFDADTPIGMEPHMAAVRAAVEALELDSVAVVGHDSGGMIARHAMVGDPRLRALGLINTEQPQGVGLWFKGFLVGRHVPGFGAFLRWVLAKPTLRRSPLVLGGSFVDRSLIDGDFDELFLRPIVEDDGQYRAAMELLQSFDVEHVRQLAAIHARLDVPVQMVWGAEDPFFPLDWAREMVGTFPDARLTVIERASLLPHEEKPAEVAAALLDVLRGASRRAA